MKKNFEQIFSHYDSLLKTSSVKVQLISYTDEHANLSCATARTCYSQKGLVLPSDMDVDEKTVHTRNKILQSTLKAGHLTTRQHSHYVFAIDGISRNVIWDFFHAHPYYNSEQVSQRYTYVDDSRSWYHLPVELPSQLEASYHEMMKKSYEAYRSLKEILYPFVHKELEKTHKLKAVQKPKLLQQMAQKKSAEFARYTLPLATNARMYHSVSALTLLRYYHSLGQSTHKEIDCIILKMIEQVLKIDYSFALDLEQITWKNDDEEKKIISLEQSQKRQAIHKKLDEQISAPYHYTSLIEYPSADSLEKQLLLQTGIDFSNTHSQENLWEYLLSPQHNPSIAQTINRVSQDSLSRNLNMFHFSFYQKISHTADSQEQRHRTLPATRLPMAEQASFAAEYVIPTAIKEHEPALEYYQNYMESFFVNLHPLLEKSKESVGFASYLLPNAYPTRSFAGGDLLNFYHKWKTRLCYNAQQEIFDLALEQVRLVEKKLPQLAKLLGAPCHTRAGVIKPICPEGSHYCGTKVWQKNLDELERIL